MLLAFTFLKALNRCSVQPPSRARIPVVPPEDGHVKARNMSRMM